MSSYIFDVYNVCNEKRIECTEINYCPFQFWANKQERDYLKKHRAILVWGFLQYFQNILVAVKPIFNFMHLWARGDNGGNCAFIWFDRMAYCIPDGNLNIVILRPHINLLKYCSKLFSIPPALYYPPKLSTVVLPLLPLLPSQVTLST